MKTIYNCHTHIFTNEIVPKKFLPLMYFKENHK